MIWVKRMLLGGFIVNVIYIAFLFILPGLSIWVYGLISGLFTGGILFFLINKEHIWLNERREAFDPEFALFFEQLRDKK